MASNALTTALELQQKDERRWWAQVISGVCERDGCTRAKLAEALGVSKQALWQWRAGVSQPGLLHWIEIRALASGKVRVRGRRLVAAAEY